MWIICEISPENPRLTVKAKSHCGLNFGIKNLTWFGHLYSVFSEILSEVWKDPKLHIDAKWSSENRLGVMRLLNIATHVPWKRQLEFFAFQLHSVLYSELTAANRRGNQDPQGNEDNLRCFVYSQFLCVAKHNNIWTVNSIPHVLAMGFPRMNCPYFRWWLRLIVIW